jgi:hypothetical protein
MSADLSERVAPGRATDALVARLIGWTLVGRWRGDEPIGRDEWVGVPPNAIDEFQRGDRDRAIAWLPPFSTDPNAATNLQREALSRFGLLCTVKHDTDGEHCVLQGSDGRHVETTAPAGQTALAICAAIIAALSATTTFLGG